MFMNSTKNIMVISLLILTILGCYKKNELIITNPSAEEAPAAVEADENVNLDETKPLIQISTSDTLKILVRQDGAPGMYLGDDNKLYGFYVDLEKMVMEEMGQNYELIPYDNIGPILLNLKSGIFHSALAAPDLPDYRSFLNLSHPYEILNFVTFVREGDQRFDVSDREALLAGFSGKRVGVQAQGHIYQVLREDRSIELIEYPTTTQALADLDKGLLDAVPDVKRIGEYYSEREGWNITAVGEVLISQNITTAFSQALDTSVVERYNEALSALIEQGRVKELYEEYFAPENLYLAPSF